MDSPHPWQNRLAIILGVYNGVRYPGGSRLWHFCKSTLLVSNAHHTGRQRHTEPEWAERHRGRICMLDIGREGFVAMIRLSVVHWCSFDGTVTPR